MSACIILAAGQGKRMRSSLPKVAHPVLGVPMVLRVIRQARAAGLERPIVVIGSGRDHVKPLLDAEGVPWVVQEEQLGTAHAVSCGLSGVRSEKSVVVLLGDVPLLRSRTISLLETRRRESGAGIAVLTTVPPDPSGYGRAVVEGGTLRRIVEERDAPPEIRAISEINTGLMAFDGELLPVLLADITPDNDQGEYYLTDAVAAAGSRGLPCIAVRADDWREVAGINDRVQLAEATSHLRRTVVRELLLAGVDIPDAESVWIEETVILGDRVSIGRGCRLSGSTVIGDGCSIGDGCVLCSTVVAPGTSLNPYTIIGIEPVS
jgi:bifunctional UDP-N-acetylglucosamine pyrophosphorylase / glucosamine-1-phosphate N-acetyltransferase